MQIQSKKRKKKSPFSYKPHSWRGSAVSAATLNPFSVCNQADLSLKLPIPIQIMRSTVGNVLCTGLYYN